MFPFFLLLASETMQQTSSKHSITGSRDRSQNMQKVKKRRRKKPQTVQSDSNKLSPPSSNRSSPPSSNQPDPSESDSSAEYEEFDDGDEQDYARFGSNRAPSSMATMASSALQLWLLLLVTVAIVQAAAGPGLPDASAAHHHYH